MANAAQFIYDQLLTNYGIKAGVGTFNTGLGIAPLSKAKTLNGTYLERERQRMGNVDLKRAPGDKYKYKQPTRGELKPIQIFDRGLISPVPMEVVDGYSESDLFGELQNATLETGIELQHSHAVAVKDAVWSASQSGFQALYGNANVNTPSTKWGASGNNVAKDIADAINRVRINSGYKANVIVMPQEVFNAVVEGAESSIRERLNYTDPLATTQEQLARLLRVEEVIVPGELNDSANPGQDAAYGELFTGDNVLIFHRNSTPVQDKINLASTFYWENSRSPFMGVMRRFNDNTNSYEVKMNGYFEVKLTAASAGNVLWDVL